MEYGKLRKLIMSCSAEDIELIELSNTADGNVKWYNYFGKHFAYF